MTTTTTSTTRVYFLAMGAFWLVFGLITAFKPGLMDLFQTANGIQAKTEFSNHVWMHDGLDILALCLLLFALSRENVGRNVLRATALAALMPTAGIAYSLLTTNYWSPLFIVAGFGCFAFAVWGFLLSARIKG